MNSKSVPECPFEPLRPSFLSRDDEFFMSLAYNQALRAWREGEVPVGAVIECGGEIIAQAHNMVESTKDPTAHAEILAIEGACRALGGWRLPGVTLYVTMEPCCMCAGAIINARIPRVVFGAYDLRFGGFGSLVNINEVGLNHKTEVLGNVLGDECRQLLSDYFKI